MYYIAQIVPHWAVQARKYHLERGYAVLGRDASTCFVADLNRKWESKTLKFETALARCNSVSNDFVALKL